MGLELTPLVVIGTDCIVSCKSNYHTIKTLATPCKLSRQIVCKFVFNEICHLESWFSFILELTEKLCLCYRTLSQVKIVWRYQRGNQKPHNEEEQTTQWPNEKVQKDKQRSTKHTYKATDRVTWTPLKTGVELRCSGRVSSSCSTGGTRRVNLVTNPVISREWGKDREVFTTSETYPWSFMT